MNELKLPEPDTHCLDDEGGRPIDVWSYSPELVREILAQQAARHAEELAAYELTVSNLQARKEELIASCVASELRARPATETDGWKLVPIEPTADMYIRGGEAFFDLVCHATDDGDTEDDQEHAASIYRAMLESAPQSQPERKPMSLDEAWDLTAGCNGISDKEGFQLVRAVEAFHDIKETP